MRERQAGISLLEIAITITILGGALTVIYGMFGAARKGQEQISAMEELDARVHKALDRVVDLLRDAGADTVKGVPDAPDASTFIVFSRLEAFDAREGTLWDAEERVFLHPGADGEAGELRALAGGSTNRLLRGVRGVGFSRTGDVIEIEIEAESTGTGGQTITVKRSAHVCLRN